MVGRYNGWKCSKCGINEDTFTGHHLHLLNFHLDQSTPTKLPSQPITTRSTTLPSQPITTDQTTRLNQSPPTELPPQPITINQISISSNHHWPNSDLKQSPPTKLPSQPIRIAFQPAVACESAAQPKPRQPEFPRCCNRHRPYWNY